MAMQHSRHQAHHLIKQQRSKEKQPGLWEGWCSHLQQAGAERDALKELVCAHLTQQRKPCQQA
jgi:hypothetical protein